MVSSLDKLLIQNKNILQKLPMLRRLSSKFLLSRAPVHFSDLRLNGKYANSYALVSERNSKQFLKVMQRLERYVGAGPIGPNKRWEYPWVLASLRLDKNMSVLDAGCGKSPIQFLLYDLGCRVSGIDPYMNVEWHGIDTRLAKDLGTQIEYRVEGLESMSFDDNTFDRVCCVSVIEHCRANEVSNEKMTPRTEGDRELHRTMMNEMVRVLKPGGLLVITTDFDIPRDNCLLESNVDIINLISVEGIEIYGEKCPESFPGEDGFCFDQLIKNSDIDITNYADTLQTSIGLTLQKIK